jgi:hypothetical protein
MMLKNTGTHPVMLSSRHYLKAGVCMPPDASSLGTPREWVNRARSNLAMARQQKTEEI